MLKRKHCNPGAANLSNWVGLGHRTHAGPHQLEDWKLLVCHGTLPPGEETTEAVLRVQYSAHYGLGHAAWPQSVKNKTGLFSSTVTYYQLFKKPKWFPISMLESITVFLPQFLKALLGKAVWEVEEESWSWPEPSGAPQGARPSPTCATDATAAWGEKDGPWTE